MYYVQDRDIEEIPRGETQHRVGVKSLAQFRLQKACSKWMEAGYAWKQEQSNYPAKGLTFIFVCVCDF